MINNHVSSLKSSTIVTANENSCKIEVFICLTHNVSKIIRCSTQIICEFENTDYILCMEITSSIFYRAEILLIFDKRGILSHMILDINRELIRGTISWATVDYNNGMCNKCIYYTFCVILSVSRIKSKKMYFSTFNSDKAV